MNAHIDSVNKNGQTALHLACLHGHKPVIERLLLARAQTNLCENVSGNTPLHILAQVDHKRRQLKAIVTDTNKNTLNYCCNNRDNGEPVQEDDESQQKSVTTELVEQPRSSLIEIIIPFAEESKGIQNAKGLQPWQLAKSEEIAILLKPRPEI